MNGGRTGDGQGSGNGPVDGQLDAPDSGQHDRPHDGQGIGQHDGQGDGQGIGQRGAQGDGQVDRTDAQGGGHDPRAGEPGAQAETPPGSEGAAPGARRRLAPSERRAQIVAGAVGYFAEAGLEGNTRDLARRLGVTQSLIFNYFATKADLIEAVYHAVYLDRLSPRWPGLVTDRGRSLRDRTVTFYTEYAAAIFTYEWMRIFMFSGLAGADLNRRYLEHLGRLVLGPLLEEIRAASAPGREPTMEDLWSLHGGIVYIGIRRFVYQMPCPEDDGPAIAAAVDRFLLGCGVPVPRPGG